MLPRWPLPLPRSSVCGASLPRRDQNPPTLMALMVRRYRVEGEVQGVGFRWYVREQARVLQLAGWVRNEPDGSVVLVAAGELAAINALERQLRVGPRHAAVRSVSSRELTSFDAFDLPTPFVIER